MKRSKVFVFVAFVTALASIGAVCPPRFIKAFEEGANTDVQRQVLVNALATIDAISATGAKRALRDVIDEVLAVHDNPTPGIPEPAWERTILACGRLLAGPAEGRYEVELLERALVAVSGLKHNGRYYTGLFERAGTAYSSAWITNVSNRGHLFEVIAARRWLDSGVVAPSDVVGFGFRTSGDLEGDLSVALVGGGEHWFDFKAADGNATLDQITKVEGELTAGGQVRRFSIAYESGHDPRVTVPGFSQAVDLANARLAGLQPPRTIEFVDAGTK